MRTRTILSTENEHLKTEISKLRQSLANIMKITNNAEKYLCDHNKEYYLDYIYVEAESGLKDGLYGH